MTSARGALGGQVQKGHWVWEGVFLGENRVELGTCWAGI